MLKSENKLQLLKDHMGYILEDGLLEEMAQVAKVRETAADEIVVNVGDHLQMIPIVIEGSIKISRENDNGEELLLYYIPARCLYNVAPGKSIVRLKLLRWNLHYY